MLMFQNGLLASFIPEILMVLAYLVCLFTPGVKSHDSNVAQTQIVAQASQVGVTQPSSAYQVTVKDFKVVSETISVPCTPPLPIVESDTSPSLESPFSTSDGLSYVDFSRPPPTILI